MNIETNPTEEVYVFAASFAQQRLWFMDQLVPGHHFYNVVTALKLTGDLNLNALENTFNTIIDRHETLRTNFKLIDGEVVQIIRNPQDTFPLTILSYPESDVMPLLIAEAQRPFNLACDSLMRVLLVDLNNNQHILLLNLHHIICDDWSMGILIKEITSLYSAYCKNLPSPLSELPLQYADFSEWQKEWLKTEAMENRLNNFASYLQNLEKLNLPSTHTLSSNSDRPHLRFLGDRLGDRTPRSYQGEVEYFALSKELTTALEIFSQQQKVTLFMTLLAVFKVLLYRLSQQNDIVIGSPIANRNRSEIEGLIGFFVNSLVLRTNFAGDPSFIEVLHRVKQVTIQAYEYQDLPFEKLVEILNPSRHPLENPLFQVVFGFENSPMPNLALPGLEVESLNLKNTTTRFDLEFHLWSAKDDFRSFWGGHRWQFTDGIRGLLYYNTAIWEKETIRDFLGYFQTLITAMIKNSNQTIDSLPLLTEAEEKQILTQWNQTTTAYPRDQSINQLFEAQVKKNAEAIALIYEDKQLTYFELNDHSNQLAHYLQKQGVTLGSVVGVCLEASCEIVVAMLAILKAGGVYLPLDSSYPQERLNFMIQDAGVSLILTQQKLVEKLPLESILCLDTSSDLIAQESSNNLDLKISSKNLAYIIYTSGSTGKPKGVMIPHKAVNRLVCNTNYITIAPSDRLAQIANISFDAATFEIWGALLNGATLVGISKNIVLSPDEFAYELKQKNIRILFITTALMQKIARSVPTAFSNLKYLLFGGEKVEPRWVRKIQQKGKPENIIHVYGPTENTTFSSYYKVGVIDEEAETIKIGKAIANTQIYILDKHLKPQPIGIVGEIYLGGDGLAKGYLNREELTKEKFINHKSLAKPENSHCHPAALGTPKGARSEGSHQIEETKQEDSKEYYLYKTGDLGILTRDGNIEFVGRIDDQVKIRGYRIELKEIETHLTNHPAVESAIVIVTEDIPQEKYLSAYIITREQVTEKQLREFLKQSLPPYMIPTTYITLAGFPLTPNGKIDRKALPKIDKTTQEIDDDYIAPSNEIEATLVKIWEVILGKKNFGIGDNFFELGGHSLLATQLISRIRDTFKIEIPVAVFFESPTIAALARYITNATRD